MHTFSVHLEGKDGALVEAQVVQAHWGMSLAKVLDEIYGLNLRGRLRAEMLIVRLPVEQSWEKIELEGQTTERAKRLFSAPDASRSSAFDRAKDRSVHILSSHDGEHTLTGNLSPYWPDDPLSTYGILVEDALVAIRSAEFDCILDRSRAVLTSPPGSRFMTPSKRTVRSFVRVGNIQYDRDAIDAVFFWLLPHLREVGAVLTDTWSISSIALNIGKLCAVYFGGPPRRVEMLPSYDDGSENSRSKTRTIVERLDADSVASGADHTEMLCLISATHTGSLAGHLRAVFSTSAIKLKPRFLALFALGESDIPYLHDLRNDARFLVLEDQEDAANEPVSIDPQVYFPLQFEDVVIQLDKALADKSRPFFDRYIGAGVIEVHRDHKEDEGQPRHHAVHLATERLLDVPEFLDRFQHQLEALPSRPAFIVSPPHEAGRLLATTAERYFSGSGHQCKMFAHPNLYIEAEPLDDDEHKLRALLRDADEHESLLVIDDVCITGTRLSQYQRYIRTERFVGRIDYLVGVARPPNAEVWNNLRRYLSFRGNGLPRHTVNFIDFVLLPDWRGEQCPWCCERRLYERWAGKDALPELLMARLELLSKSAPSGLTDDLFVAIPELPPMRLGPNSLFTREEATQSEVFAAISAALQYLRSETSVDRPRLGPRHFPVSTVLKHDDYLCSKWTDSILRATFFRAASVDELTYAKAEQESERTKALRDLITQSANGEHDIALEVLLAANLGKCRVVNTPELFASLKEFGTPDAFSCLLGKLPT